MKTNFFTVISVYLLSLNLQAQVSQAPAPPGMPKKGTFFYHRELGKWWQNSEMVKKLQLNDGQVATVIDTEEINTASEVGHHLLTNDEDI